MFIMFPWRFPDNSFLLDESTYMCGFDWLSTFFFFFFHIVLFRIDGIPNGHSMHYSIEIFYNRDFIYHSPESQFQRSSLLSQWIPIDQPHEK